MSTIAAILTEYRYAIAALLIAVLAVLAAHAPRWSYTLDAALIALYVVRPSAFVLGCVLTIARYTPALATDIAGLVKADEAEGMTRAFWRFVLVGWREDTPAPPKAMTGKTVALTPPVMTLRAMLAYVNNEPDRVPHCAIIGPSGSGKTTLATVVLSERPGTIIVLTAKEGDAWGGLPYIGIDDDASYTTARQTFTTLDQETRDRLLAIKRNTDPGEWLTIVVDDFSTLQGECPVAPDVIKRVARIGRALRVRLIMLSDSALVKAIGLEGEGETRANFAFVRLERGHSAILERDGATTPLDIRGADRVAQTINLAGREWVPVPGVPNQGGNGTGTGNGTGNEVSVEVLRALRAAGWTREQARAKGLNFRDSKWTDAA
jgi:hypothetical protein